MNKCIMPEMPYCPVCKYGHVTYKDEDYDGIEQPTECEWHCMIGKIPSEEDNNEKM